MLSPEVVSDKRIHLKKSSMPRGIKAFQLAPWQVPWANSVPGYEEKVPSWVAESTIKAFQKSETDSPYELPSRSLVNIKGKKVPVVKSLPFHPSGRTGRNQNLGQLWLWGPSFTADALIECEGKVLLGRRADNDLWGLFGGFNDSGEKLEKTAIRETFEESNLIIPEKYRGLELISGPMNDVRDGDHAWIEGIVFLFRISKADIIEQKLRADGKECKKLAWVSLERAARMKLHVNQQETIKLIL